MEMSKTERIWNMVSMFVFVLLLIGLGFLMDVRDTGIGNIGILDLVLISLATYRMIRLMVYDRIFKLVRDISRSFEGIGIGDSLRAIITCPWCAGVWIALFNVGIFLLVPYGDLFIYIMAIAGVATLFQLGVNILGIIAEEKQIDLKEKREKTGFRKPL
ncbi:MAG: DUF1360 domain-containing protein [Marinilabiliales bacterium]|nr:MAG: DUF1360 domain-containing protein [Bacteroidia bacterium]TVR75025.1 MAG: DUF1360 domain-containing protein [Marinilabiliales bacterium]